MRSATGELPGIKVGRRILFPRDQIDALVPPLKAKAPRPKPVSTPA